MREFTDFEKQLIRLINSGQGNNLPNLIDPYLRDVSISVNTQTNATTIIFETANQQQINNLIDRVSDIEAIIIQSVNLIKLFEDKGYIFTYTRANQIQNPFTYGTAAVNLPSTPYVFPDQRVSELLTRYSIQDIFVTPELAVFIKDDFIPRDEKRFRKQFRLATIALIVAISGVFVNLYFNVKKEYFSDGQKFDPTQFQTLLDHLDGNKNLNNNYKDSLINENKSTRDTTIIETIIATEVTTNSTIKTKKGSH
jgi:hypothetical protein